MKYNVKQAVSGIQGEMDKASRNQLLGKALGGLAGGISAGAKGRIARDQTKKMGDVLGQQSGYFEGLASDPTSSKFEKLIANENLLRLGMLQANLNPATVGDFGKDYKNIMGSDSLFDTLAGIERAKLIAAGYGAKTAATKKQQETLDDIVKNQAAQAGGGGMFDGVTNLFSGLFSGFGSGAPAELPSYADVDLGL